MNRYGSCLALVVIYTVSFRLLTLNRPFDYDAEGSGSLNAVLSRSYLRFDWAQTRGMPVLSLDPNRATSIVFYPDHPPLVPLLIVPFYRVLGVGEWQTRLPIALTTIGAILMLYRLLAVFATRRLAVVAAAIFAAAPMTLYFGGFADVIGMPLIFFVLVELFAYLRFQRAPGRRTFLSLLAAVVLAGACDWPAFVLVPIVATHFLATRPRRDWWWALGVASAACAVFGVLYVYITIVTHSSWPWMADLFSRRSAWVGGRAYTWHEWLTHAAAVNARYHTVPLLVAAATGIGAFGFRRDQSSGASVARLLLAWAAVYVLIGGKALYDHEWGWSLLTPGIAAAAALLIEQLSVSAITVTILVFAVWTTSATFASLYPARRDRPFTPMQMAQAIRVAAPDPRDVALVVGNEAEAQLWFYGDRMLRTGIWSVDDFQRRLSDDTVDVMFNFDEQSWKARASGVVFPRIWAKSFAKLHAYLRRRYPLAPLPPPVADMFDVFELRER
jgi:dolichyl-phosphate-mannose-protein mannosyltransferase